MLPLGVATVHHLPPSHPIPNILDCHTKPLHSLLRYICESSSYPPVWQLQHLILNLTTLFSTLKPSYPPLLNFVFKAFNLSCPSDI